MDGTTRVCTPHSAAPLSAFLLGYGLGGLSSDLNIARAESQSIYGFPLGPSVSHPEVADLVGVDECRLNRVSRAV